MNEINKTLYIPLHARAKMSERGLILDDKKAEEIWSHEAFKLKRRSRSKWLTYFLTMRARVYDDWVRMQRRTKPDAVVIELGVGMDSRALRVGGNDWYDVDLPEVIAERQKYYEESEHYHMIASDVMNTTWLDNVPVSECAIVVMEGIGMYLSALDIDKLLADIDKRFARVYLLIDVYTPYGAKMSRYKNPVNDVGVTKVHGVERPELLMASNNFRYIAEHSMTPQYLLDELRGFDRWFFSTMFAGKMAQRVYRLYEFKK